MTLYDILEVEQTATKEEIKSSYRRLSKIYHPDVGGDEKIFKLIAKAYEVLSDDSKRRRYDEGESIEDINKADPVVNTLSALFIKILESNDEIHCDIFELMREALIKSKIAIKSDIDSFNKRIKKYERAKTKINKDYKKLFNTALNSQVQEFNKKIKNLNQAMEECDQAILYLKECKYDKEKMEQLENIIKKYDV